MRNEVDLFDFFDFQVVLVLTIVNIAGLAGTVLIKEWSTPRESVLLDGNISHLHSFRLSLFIKRVVSGTVPWDRGCMNL